MAKKPKCIICKNTGYASFRDMPDLKVICPILNCPAGDNKLIKMKLK